MDEAPRFRAEVDIHLAHGVHLLALTGASHAVPPGYARGDGRLRAALGERAPEIAPESVPSLQEILAGGAEPSADAAWFERRWVTAGEADSCRRDAERVATEAEATPTGGLLSGWTVTVVAATGLRVGAWPRSADPDGRRAAVAVGHGTPGAVAALAAIAARIPVDPRLAALPQEDVDLVRLHCAGSTLAAALGDVPEIGAVLAAVVDTLLPPQHQGRRTVDMIARLRAADLLDQPPGEIERLGKGLARRYADRLHRAWLRGFFVPRGQDAHAWARALRAESGAPR